jgi:hypothetical protein
MSETAVLTIGIIGAIGVIFAFVRWVLPIACRYFVKPRIKTKISLGKKIDVESPVTKKKLFTAREVSTWLCTNRNIELTSVTFRRLCHYQRNCILYQFLLRTGLLRDRKWCSYASVDDWDCTGTFVCPTEEDEKKEQAKKHFMEGRLTLKPKENRIVKDYWVALDMPLRLRDNKSHLVELTLSFGLKSKDTPFLNRLVSRALNSAGRETTYLYSEQRKLYISCADKKEVRKERETTDRVARDTEYRVAYSYHGLEEFAECQKIVIDLVNGRQSVLKKLNPLHYSKVPASELRSTIKEDFPNIEIVFTQPPDGIYRMADEEDFKTITQMWPNVRQFVLKFLDCESFTQLLRDYTKYFIFLPEILLMTYQYLVIASENPIVSIAANISNRSNVLAIALVSAVYSEFKFKIQLARRKRTIRKRLDKMVSYCDPSRSKSSYEGDVH